MGIKAEVAAITAAAMRGEIDFAREPRAPRRAARRACRSRALERVYDERLALSPGAERMLAGFRAAGAKTLLVSGGFTFFTDRLAARLGFDDTVANTLEIVDGQLTGRVIAADRRRRGQGRAPVGDARARWRAATASRSRSATARTTCRC